MHRMRGKTSKVGSRRRLQWAAAGVGIVVIAALLYAFFSMAHDHMSRAREVSRHSQWHVHAPVEGAHAAALLHGTQP